MHPLHELARWKRGSALTATMMPIFALDLNAMLATLRFILILKVKISLLPLWAALVPFLPLSIAFLHDIAFVRAD
jgi:hypothetical protein